MYDWLYRRGRTPWVAAGRLQSDLVERLLTREEEWHSPHVGMRLLDIGCGTGEHCLTAARRGWDVTGVDASTAAIGQAREAAAVAGVRVRFLTGDVRRLGEVAGPPGDVSLFVDVGCYHGLSLVDRRAVADGVRRLAAPRASMVVVGLDRRPGLFPVGVTTAGLADDFPGWRVEPGETFQLGLPGPLRRARFRVFRLLRE